MNKIWVFYCPKIGEHLTVKKGGLGLRWFLRKPNERRPSTKRIPASQRMRRELDGIEGGISSQQVDQKGAAIILQELLAASKATLALRWAVYLLLLPVANPSCVCGEPFSLSKKWGPPHREGDVLEIRFSEEPITESEYVEEPGLVVDYGKREG